ncbi:hypothetical protein HanIR_Chr07g0327821 [Helianthus annuus]|nr:hypothetical protein HanIR_Chr07g0327821 [Helianthus annuus]
MEMNHILQGICAGFSTGLRYCSLYQSLSKLDIGMLMAGWVRDRFR